MRRKESLYAVIGGIVGAVLVLAVCSVMPIGAQNEDGDFGHIYCRSLTVVKDLPNKEKDPPGRSILLPMVSLAVNEYGGFVIAHSASGLGRATMENSESGGVVEVTGRRMAIEADGKASLGVNEYGGMVTVTGKEKRRAILGVSNVGHGLVRTFDKNGYYLATLK